MPSFPNNLPTPTGPNSSIWDPSTSRIPTVLRAFALLQPSCTSRLLRSTCLWILKPPLFSERQEEMVTFYVSAMYDTEIVRSPDPRHGYKLPLEWFNPSSRGAGIVIDCPCILGCCSLRPFDNNRSWGAHCLPNSSTRRADRFCHHTRSSGYGRQWTSIDPSFDSG